ncbi:MAG: ferrous iron transport protein B [Clostridiales bacterium]|nr:ferrous iron transport protein B [Clostridiales bacterium]
MSLKIALAGNPNSGKTTLFNSLTGSNQFVGNWPGVTVEKKEGKLKKHDDVDIIDLPGIYSLSPYTLEEVVARNYLIDQRPDAILNIIDGTNLERNLYLTTQLIELGIPVVVAINMMDVVRKNGDTLNTKELENRLGCRIIEISALKGDKTIEAAELAIKTAKESKKNPMHTLSGPVEHALAHIEEAIIHDMPEEQQRWYAIKIFERDDKVLSRLNVSEDKLAHIENDIKAAESEMDDDSESIITNERYVYIAELLKGVYRKKDSCALTVSDKIDKIVTNRWLGLPIFAAVMFVIYWVAMVGVGASATDWANDGLFGDGFNLFGLWVPGIPVLVESLLDMANCADWLKGLVLDGIVAGVGAVLGFVPQMLVLFLMLAFVEACGYMARVAFVLDRVFRRFGLSGKSFIPILIGTGCGIPGIMASRTIENERDRRMTIMTTTFIPCGAKVPFIAMIAGAIFGGSAWVSTGAYFIGIAAIICSGIILKKTKMFAGEPAPFVMELPAYHMPTIGNVLRSMWERGWSFIKKAGTIILLSTVVIWFLSRFGWTDGAFGMLEEEQISNSILASVGNAIAWLFIPLGWGNWQATVASITGLVAKENIVGTMGVLYGAEGDSWGALSTAFTSASAMSFLIFNLLCAPCFAAIGAIRREMNNAKWTWFAIGYECGFAYVVSLVVYQMMMMFAGEGSVFGIIISFILIAAFIWLMVRPYKEASVLDKKVIV